MPEIVTRTITGIFIVGITLAAIYFSEFGFLALLTLIGFFGSREYLQLEWRGSTPLQQLIIPFIFSALILCIGLGNIYEMKFFYGLALIICPVLLVFTPLRQNTPQNLISKGRVVFACFAYVILPLIAGTLLFLNEYRYEFALIPVILIWTNDVFAYLVGSKFGKRKIAPLISPGKSIEGTLGGGLLTIAAAYGLSFIWSDVPTDYFMCLGAATPVFALFGDLYESSVKRTAGVKDSGKILPGHGGILDRYDSFLFVLPLSVVMTYIFVLL